MEATEYFQSYRDYFWEWDNEVHTPGSLFETVAITGGATIAYEQYIFEILEYLSDDSWPPFGSLLLAMLATNPQADQSIDKVFSIMEAQAKPHGSVHTYYTAAKQFLHTLSQLPGQYKIGNKRKQMLQAIFHDCHNRISSEKAKKMLSAYRQLNDRTSGFKVAFSAANYYKDFRTIQILASKYPDVDSIITQISGIAKNPEIVEEVFQEPQISENPDFVTELILNPQTFHVGALIKRIWSGLNIPLHHFQSGSQPLGGVSDLTTKGDFDRLLISEFANDDDVFTLRIANNEALFIEREVPPETEEFSRVIIVDASLRNWGTPRLLGFAAALGIATHPKSDIDCRIFIVGESFREAAYATVDEVIDALDYISTDGDAGHGLAQLLESGQLEGNPEIFIISSAEALRMENMRHSVAEYYSRIKYIVEPDPEGHLDFFRIQNKSRKHIQHVFMPLDELWLHAPKVNFPKPKRVKNSSIPIYPILFPLPRTDMGIFFTHGKYYILSGNRSLMRTDFKTNDQSNHGYHERFRGVEILLENLSVKSGGMHALKVDNNHHHLYSFYPDLHLISFHNLDTGEYHKSEAQVTDRDDWNLFAIDTKGQNDGVFLIAENGYENYRIELSEGRLALKVEMTTSLSAMYRSYLDSIRVLSYRPGSSVLSNCMPVCIDDESMFRMNKMQLKVYLSDNQEYSNFRLILARHFSRDIIATYDKTSSGTVYEFREGSTVQRDKRGIFILKSADEKIPVIYMPACVDFNLGLATDKYFAGNEYFFKPDSKLAKITVNEFDKRFLMPFINRILDHAART